MKEREPLSQQTLGYARMLDRALKGAYDFTEELNKLGGKDFQMGDGEENSVFVDREFVAMLRGAASGAYEELKSEGHKDFADKIVSKIQERSQIKK